MEGKYHFHPWKRLFLLHYVLSLIPMKNARLTFCLLLTNPLLFTLTAKPSMDETIRSPNVIVIMADDLGAEGLNCYDSTLYTTPRLDQMAAEGALFNNAYSTPLCTPTRVMIMTGQYPNRTGFLELISKDAGARMPAKLKTFGHYFKDAGYKTAIAGKWQLGKFHEHPNQPVEHGFDEYCMWTWQNAEKKTSRFYEPEVYQNGKFIQGSERDFGPDIYTNFLLDFIDRSKDDPFFIYFPMALVHSPYVQPPSLKELGHSKYPEDLDDNHTINFGHMITYMDMIIGKFMDKLKEHGIDDNTLLIFTGDNGTGRSITSTLPGMDLPGGKGNMIESGTRVPLLCWWPGKVPAGERDGFFCLVDVLPTTASLSGIPVDDVVDGMDLSHNLLKQDGDDRDHVLMAYKSDRFVRTERFRLHSNGNFYDIPISSNKKRYSEELSTNPEHTAEKSRMQKILDDFMKIKPPEDQYLGLRGSKSKEPKPDKPTDKKAARQAKKRAKKATQQ